MVDTKKSYNDKTLNRNHQMKAPTNSGGRASYALNLYSFGECMLCVLKRQVPRLFILFFNCSPNVKLFSFREDLRHDTSKTCIKIKLRHIRNICEYAKKQQQQCYLNLSSV